MEFLCLEPKLRNIIVMDKFNQREGLEYARNKEEFDIKPPRKRRPFYQLPRGITESKLWISKKPFDDRSALIDLHLMAKYTHGSIVREVAGIKVKISRGQMVASNRYLQKRWKWKSKTRVQKFLNRLERGQQIGRKRGQGITVITICDYGR